MAVIEPIYATLAVEETQNTVNLALEPDILPTIIEGISPEVELEEVEGGVQMTVTTKSGEKTALIPRGPQGETGEKGDAFTYADFTEEQKTELIQGPIADAQDAAVQAVEDAGQEVLDSIPPDYQQMVDEVTDMANRKADKNGTVLTSTLSRGRKANTTIGPASFAFGYNVEASGAESFAEGTNTVASGNNAHAEGGGAVASGLDSHAQGWRTTANHRSQTVFGECNVEDPSAADSESRGTYVEIVGNGTSVNDRSNARTLDWNGNEVLAGDLTVHAGDANEKTVGGLAREVSGLSDGLGKKLDAPAAAGTSGQVLTSDGQGGQSWQTPSGGDVTDVQVNGTSVVNHGVANIPVATSSTLGTVFINPSLGLYVASSGSLTINGAGTTYIKAGTNSYFPLVPARQHESTFYGLSKAAGDSTQSASSNAVGVYTDEAKKAIRKMLGIPNQEWEKIGEYTVSEDTASFEITTDGNGQPFELSNMLAKIWLEASTTGTRDYITAACLTYRNDGVNITSFMPTKRYMTNTGAACYMQFEACVKGGNVVANGFVANGPTSTQIIEQLNQAYDTIKSIRGIRLSQYTSTQTLIPAGTVIHLYGIRID